MQGGATGTGTVSLVAPSTSTNRTLTLPDSAGTVATAESTLTQFNASGSAPVYACRAWVNFNGTGTVAIRASGNVSSITDNGTGDYTVNFATSMPDGNYSMAGVYSKDTTTGGSMSVRWLLGTPPLAASCRIIVGGGGVTEDQAYIGASFFR